MMSYKKYFSKGFLIAGTHSSVGKSSVSIGLMRLLKRKGLNVKPFKVGPDYIDPSHHVVACGSPSYNLDSWMCKPQYIRRLYHDVMGDDGFAVVEGVMGLFDGASSTKNTASSAEIASLLQLPIVLVIDGKAMARSVAALIKGYTQFDPKLNFIGVIANRVTSQSHARILKDAIEHYTPIKFLGNLPDNPDLKIQNRHLGLFQGHEQNDRIYDSWSDHIESHIDINYLLSYLGKKRITSTHPKPNTNNRWNIKTKAKFTVAIAKDPAFQFIYQDTIDLLQQSGGSIKYFSPIHDSRLPSDTDWIYLPGGYPELYANKLSKNKSMIDQINKFWKSGSTIIAECGGLMYLGQSIINESGIAHKMAGIFNFSTSLKPKTLTLGYRQLKFTSTNNALRRIAIKGHEFHFSKMVNNREKPIMMAVNNNNNINDGYRQNNCFALYTHIYWASSPQWLNLILKTINCHKSMDAKQVNND